MSQFATAFYHNTAGSGVLSCRAYEALSRRTELPAPAHENTAQCGVSALSPHGSLILNVCFSAGRASVEYQADGKPSKAMIRSCNAESGVT